MEQVSKQVCTIKIIFPVDTDEQAIAYKKKIAEAVAEIANANMQFTLTSISPRIDNA